MVRPGLGGEFVVYCDMTLYGGGWTIIQRRMNSKLSFDRSYSSYETGFGDFTENFWLGLDKISRSTNGDAPTEIYFGFDSFHSRSVHAYYSQFSVGPESSGYELQIGGYSRESTAGDSLKYNNGQKFSAHDRDQVTGRNSYCRRSFSGFNGGWWFKECDYFSLNSKYYENGEHNRVIDGLTWQTAFGRSHSLKTTVIAIRTAH
jgi:hypothetical protein